MITGRPGCQLAGVEAFAQSEICKASTVRRISGINRPIFKGYVRITRTIPFPSIIKTFLTVFVVLTSFEIIP